MTEARSSPSSTSCTRRHTSPATPAPEPSRARAAIEAASGTAHELMAIYEWTTLKQAEGYTRKASRKKLVDGAMHLIDPDYSANESVPPETAVASGGTMRGKKS